MCYWYIIILVCFQMRKASNKRKYYTNYTSNNFHSILFVVLFKCFNNFTKMKGVGSLQNLLHLKQFIKNFIIFNIIRKCYHQVWISLHSSSYCHVCIRISTPGSSAHSIIYIPAWLKIWMKNIWNCSLFLPSIFSAFFPWDLDPSRTNPKPPLTTSPHPTPPPLWRATHVAPLGILPFNSL